MFRECHKRRQLAHPTDPKDRRALQRRVRKGTVVMPHKGLYLDAEKWEALSYSERIIWTLRSVCQLYPGAVLCGPSAAAAYGLTSVWKIQKNVHIAVTDRSKAGRHGFIIARYYKNPPATCKIDGMLVTDLFQTLMDCARMLDFINAFEICSTGLRRFKSTVQALMNYIGGKMRLWGIIRARYLAERAEPLCENGGEAVALAMILELGYMRPRVQVVFLSPLDGGEIRGDFCWERADGTLVVGELDGRWKYMNPDMMDGGDMCDVILKEKDRESELNMLRVYVVRFQMKHVWEKEPLRERLEAAQVPHDPEAWRSPFKGFRCMAY